MPPVVTTCDIPHSVLHHLSWWRAWSSILLLRSFSLSTSITEHIVAADHHGILIHFNWLTIEIVLWLDTSSGSSNSKTNESFVFRVVAIEFQVSACILLFCFTTTTTTTTITSSTMVQAKNVLHDKCDIQKILPNNTQHYNCFFDSHAKEKFEHQ